MKRRLQIALLVIQILLVTLLVFQSPTMIARANSAADEWPMFHHDLAHTGYSSSSSPLTNQTLWTFATSGAVETSPAVVDGVVFFGSDDGSVYAVNASSGGLIWNYSTGGPVQSSPAVVEGVVYIGGFHSHMVFALNASNGVPIWSSPLNSSIPHLISSVAVANGVVYVDVWNYDDSGGILYAFNASTGDLVWDDVPSAALASSPAVYDGKVYIGTSMGYVVALDAASGVQVWAHFVDGIICFCIVPFRSNGLVYVGTSTIKRIRL